MKKTQKEIAADAAQGIYTPELNSKLNYHTEYLLRTGLYFEADRDDVRSRLSEAIWRGAPDYDETLTDFCTYAERVLSNRVKNLIDTAARRKNRTPEMLSLFHKEGKSETPLAELVADDNAERQFRLMEIRDEIAYGLTLLPRRRRLLCKAIMKGWNTRRISKWLHISMKTIPAELAEIRKVFVSAGIEGWGGAR